MLMYPEFTLEDRARIDGYRAVFELERAKMVEPHVTLVFGVKGIAQRALVGLSETVARGQGAFEVSFDRIRFERDMLDGVVKGYLDIGTGGEVVRGVHNALYRGTHAKEYRQEITFVPHMTIATLDDEGQIEIATREAQRITLPLRGRISALSVMRLSKGKLAPLAEIGLAE